MESAADELLSGAIAVVAVGSRCSDPGRLAGRAREDGRPAGLDPGRRSSTGLAIEAGVNAPMLSTMVDDAHHFYRERFLREKYGIGASGPTPRSAPDEDVIDVADILDAEIIEERGDAGQVRR